MKIRQLEVRDFRGFKALKILFPEAPNNLAVFVGINGSGKTSVLEGIVRVVRVFLRLSEADYLDDITHFNQHYNSNNIKKGAEEAYLSTEIEYGNMGVFDAEERILKVHTTANNTSGEGDASITRGMKDREKEAFKKKLFTFIYYPTERFVKDHPDLKSIPLNQLDRWSALEQSMAKQIDFSSFFNWYRSIEDIENEEIRFTKNTEYREKELEAVRRAIRTFLPNVSNPRIQRQPWEEFVVEKNGERLSISNLSHGERLVFAMIGDIARRLSIANPDLENPLEGEGIVLIDEIELHLHPGWQRQIVPSLTRTFPNIQFIITTHSPQVISSVVRESVFLLENFQLRGIPASLGRDSNAILEEVFMVPERPDDIRKKLERVYALMEQPEKMEEAKALLQEIEQTYEVSRDEDILQAKMHLEFLEE